VSPTTPTHHITSLPTTTAQVTTRGEATIPQHPTLQPAAQKQPETEPLWFSFVILASSPFCLLFVNVQPHYHHHLIHTMPSHPPITLPCCFTWCAQNRAIMLGFVGFGPQLPLLPCVCECRGPPPPSPYPPYPTTSPPLPSTTVDTLAVPLMVNKPLKHCWDVTEGCELVSNPSCNECDEIMVSFMMYMVSDSDKRGAKGARDSVICESNSVMNENNSAMTMAKP
jgi:hypothetical protein